MLGLPSCCWIGSSSLLIAVQYAGQNNNSQLVCAVVEILLAMFVFLLLAKATSLRHSTGLISWSAVASLAVAILNFADSSSLLVLSAWILFATAVVWLLVWMLHYFGNQLDCSAAHSTRSSDVRRSVQE